MPSRRDSPPSWRELAVRVAVTHVPHARGVWRRSGDYATGWFSSGRPLRIVAAPSDVDVTFAYRRGDGTRVEGGRFLYASDGRTAHLREPDGTVISAPHDRILLADGPEKLLMAEIDSPVGRMHRTVDATITEVELLGRRAWRAEAAHGRFWVDDATGVLLRSEQGRTGTRVAEFVELDLATEVTDADVGYDGPSTPLALPSERPPTGPTPRARVVAPTLSWWPRGARPDLRDGNAATGRARASIPLAWPDQVVLDRAPLSDDPPEVSGDVVWRWSTPEWQYALSTGGRSSLTVADLRAVADGLDA